jgi:hypothetical protein
LELVILASSKFALELIGSKLIVSRELIGHGVIALNGDESVKLVSEKLLVGIDAGCLVSKLHESTTRIWTSLLIAALKASSYEDKEITDILYQVMVAVDLLNVVAFAPR